MQEQLLSISPNQKVILGGPGTGKTTYLLDIVSTHLKNGIPPERMAVVSFTKSAIKEVIQRCGIDKDRVPYFKTLHSLAFSQLNLSKNKVISSRHLKEISDSTRIKILGKQAKYLDIGEELPEGDIILFHEGLSRVRQMTLDEYALKYKLPVTFSRFEYLSTFYRKYKEEYGILDFTDMLIKYNNKAHKLPVDVAIVDEAQDLNDLQWDITNKIFSDVPNLYIAGDDDQAIYSWSGASVNKFLSLDGEKKVLQKSHRLTKDVFDLGDSVIKKVSQRYEKQWSPRDEKGKVTWHNKMVSLNFDHSLVLSRNMCHLRMIEKYLFEQGKIFSTKLGPSIKKEHAEGILAYESLLKGKAVSHKKAAIVVKLLGKVKELEKKEYTKEELGIDDKAWFLVLKGIPKNLIRYYTKVLRSGQKLTAEPNIVLSTIHGSKGSESSKVILLTDVTRSSLKNKDDLHRIFYVGITRAKDELHILLPQTNNFYRLFMV
jgi:superfamily I DNA/RNA helicase